MAVPSPIVIPNSPFETIGIVSDGITGTAPTLYVASTTSTLAQILAAGFGNPLFKFIKANDIFFINYLDTSVFPLDTGEASIYGEFIVQYDPTLNNYNFILRSAMVTGIAALGVHSATYSNAGGSATTTITDPAINPNSVVIARWQSSANAVIIKTVLPANGTLTVVSSADPGVSVLEYFSILPSVALQNAGVYAAQYSYADTGATGTIVIANPLITAGMVVTANFLSQTNSAEVKTAIAGAGTITIVATADPGVSVIEYVAALPSSALTTLGFYAATYTNAGGSATTTITDATITSTSIVVADWASQTNAVEIEKVTPGSGSLVILSSGDPGASVLNYQATPVKEGTPSGTFLVSANNLSDVASASASLANLGGLALAGGQLTGSVLTVKANGTVSAGAVTANGQSGIITAAVTTVAAATTAITFNNNKITSTSVMLVSLMGGTNTTIPGVQLSCVYVSAGVATLNVTNNNVAGTALNGNVLIGFAIL